MAIKNKKIAVVIPAYKAAETLPSVIGTIPSFIDHIIIVDDGSRDNTPETVRRSADARTVLVVHPVNQGVGGAVLTGYAKANELGCDIFVKMDADGQMKPQHLPSLLEPLLAGLAHYSKGNRFAHADELRSMPFLRRLGNTLHSYMTKAATGHWHVFDATNGYTAIDAATYRDLSHRHLSRDYFFETSMLFELNLVGAKVADVAIPAVYEGEKSHIRSHHITVKFPLMLIRGWLITTARRLKGAGRRKTRRSR